MHGAGGERSFKSGPAVGGVGIRRWLGCHPWIDAAAIGVTALLVRAIYLEQLAGTDYIEVVIGDAWAYHAWGTRLAEGGWRAGESFYQAPLYPYVLGVLYELTGPSVWAARVVQALLGAATASLLAVAGRLWFGRVAGAVAGAIACVYPAFVFHAAVLQKTTVGLFLVSLVLVLIGWDRARTTAWKAALIGVVLGLLVLTRENALVWLPVLAAYPLFRSIPWRRRWGWSAGVVGGLAVVLLPVVVRNGVMTGEWHLTTSQFGPNFYIGNNPDATGVYRPLRWGRADARYEADDALNLAEQATGRELTRGEASVYWFGEARAYIANRPIDWLRLNARKLDLLLGSVELGDTEDQYTHGEAAPVVGWLNPVLHFGVLLPLAAIGLAIHARRWREHGVLLALAASYAAAVVAFYVMARYRLPLAPLLILYAAAASEPSAWREAVRNGRPWIAVGLVAAALLSLVTNRETYPIRAIRSATESNAGVYFAEQGDPERAVRRLRAAIAHRPDLPEAYNNLGAVFYKFGRPELAVVAFEEAVRLSGGAEDARRNLERARRLLERSPSVEEQP